MQTLNERSSAVSESGRRAVNQDAVLLETLPHGLELAAVADGMGGHAGGEVASQHALKVLRAQVAAGRDLVDAVRKANTAVFQEAHDHPEYLGMGTTIVALLRDGAEYLIANVGDSRAYRIDGSGVQQLTQDHSYIAEAVRSGLSLEEAEKSPWRNAVTRSVGTASDVEVDCFGPFDANEPNTFLLCSDGLYRTLAEADLAYLAGPNSDLADAAKALVASAFQNGSDDNITAALVRFGAA
jgi:protein phosphatase